jgi:predicted deacylase
MTTAAPDIERYRGGNSGIPFVWSFAAEAPGPHVMINALTHGNEPCGATALVRLLEEGVRPKRGRLTASFANVEAYAAFRERRDPPARFLDRDMNRLWRDDWIDADATSREAARARALRPVLADVDALLDIHSTASVRRPFFVLADLAKTRALADRMGWPATQQLMPGGCGEGRHLIDYGRFSDPADPAVALAVECGRHGDAESDDVAFAASIRFLAALGAIEAPLDPPAQPVVRYRTRSPYIVRSDCFEMLASDAGFVSVAAGEAVARDGCLTVVAPFDATIIAPRPAPAKGTVAFLWAVPVRRDDIA